MSKRITLLLLTLLIGMLTTYMRWIEPNWIETTHHPVRAPTTQPVRIAQLSDLHIRSIGRRESNILEALSHEQPDAIVITGDSIAEDANHEALRSFLKELHAPLGV